MCFVPTRDRTYVLYYLKLAHFLLTCVWFLHFITANFYKRYESIFSGHFRSSFYMCTRQELPIWLTAQGDLKHKRYTFNDTRCAYSTVSILLVMLKISYYKYTYTYLFEHKTYFCQSHHQNTFVMHTSV